MGNVFSILISICLLQVQVWQISSSFFFYLYGLRLQYLGSVVWIYFFLLGQRKKVSILLLLLFEEQKQVKTLELYMRKFNRSMDVNYCKFTCTNNINLFGDVYLSRFLHVGSTDSGLSLRLLRSLIYMPVVRHVLAYRISLSLYTMYFSQLHTTMHLS